MYKLVQKIIYVLFIMVVVWQTSDLCMNVAMADARKTLDGTNIRDMTTVDYIGIADNIFWGDQSESDSHVPICCVSGKQDTGVMVIESEYGNKLKNFEIVQWISVENVSVNIDDPVALSPPADSSKEQIFDHKMIVKRE